MELTAVLEGAGVRANRSSKEEFLRHHLVAIPGGVKAGLKISIITVTYNSAATIGDTLESVKRQTYGNIEHIIVDGNSTDNTMEIVRSYSHVAHSVSEPDGGIYDAMNKGIALATGDIIGILNSDDVYAHPEVLAKVAAGFKSDDSLDTLYGDLNYVKADDTSLIVRKWRSGRFRRSSFTRGWMPPHPTFFVRKEVYQKVGGFNLKLRSSADYELMLRILFKNNFRTGYIRDVLVKMRTGGASNASLARRIKANGEDRLAWALNNLKPKVYTLYLKPLRKVFQFVHADGLKRLPIISHMF